MKSHFLATVENTPIAYLNMAYQGYLVAENARQAKTLGVDMSNSNLPLDEDHKLKIWFTKRLPSLLHDNILIPLKTALKGTLRTIS